MSKRQKVDTCQICQYYRDIASVDALDPIGFVIWEQHVLEVHEKQFTPKIEVIK